MKAKIERLEKTGLYNLHLLDCTPEDIKEITHFINQLVLNRIDEKLKRLENLLTNKFGNY